MPLGLILDERFSLHENPPGHPESSDRNRTLLTALAEYSIQDGVFCRSGVPADREWVMRVHSREHFERIRSTSGRARVALDPDTSAGPYSFDTAMLAAGAGVNLLDLLGSGKIDSGFAALRPPGHHAETHRAMGFCLINNVAVVAQQALDRKVADKVAVVDFDVHHGNGTQEIFYSRRDVLYVSSHQYPLYPGTGAFQETGIGEGSGFTVNFPMASGLGDEFVSSLYSLMVLPILREYEPDLILVSAGYDAHMEDPLAGMRMTSTGFASLVSLLNSVAEEVCDGRILYFLEGGYNLSALASCVKKTIDVLLTSQPGPVEITDSDEFKIYRDVALSALGDQWKSIR